MLIMCSGTFSLAETTRFDAVEKKLDTSEKSMENRFDAVEKKLDVSEQSTETRFDAVEKKLDFIKQFLKDHFGKFYIHMFI